jgi:hypothetical protein
MRFLLRIWRWFYPSRNDPRMTALKDWEDNILRDRK